MEWQEILMLIAAGLFAGVINTLAGGGSLITMPLLIFMGLPPVEANASNRIALFVQNIFAVQGFRSKGVFLFPYSLWVAISAAIGAILGAKIAVDISGELFRRILAVVMVMVMVLTLLKPYLTKKFDIEDFSKGRVALSVFLFFFVGIYGGFIQAGVGFLVIAVLTNVHGLGMAKTNSIKVFVILIYSVFAIIVFYLEGKIRWEYGLILAIGNATGGWVASRWSVGKDDKWIRMFLIITVVALAIKLWFF
ncbi:MAG: sulfite exporter TauE/SafE family protein [Cytophagales bacterium]|nr:sulfite exporter TauE/SafE family protein [Cytophagales bacterium]